MKEINLSNGYDKYLEYLNSRTWSKIRNEALERDKYECSICRSPYNLEVHHLRYPDVLGTEPLSDLMTLCRDCHKKLEDYKKGHEVERKMVEWIPPRLVLWAQFDTEEEAKRIAEELREKSIWYDGRNSLVFYAKDKKTKCIISHYLTDDELKEAKDALKDYDTREMYQSRRD